MRTENNIQQQKKAMLQALEKSLGIVTSACKSVGIDRGTHYNWIKDDPEYKQAVEEIDNVSLDFAESKLHSRINEGSDTAIIFYLKTKGKKRGYVEQNQSDDKEIKITIERRD